MDQSAPGAESRASSAASASATDVQRRPAAAAGGTPDGAPAPATPSYSRLLFLGLCGALLLAVGAVFGQTVGFEFVSWDDPHYIFNNAVICGGLTGDGVCWAFTKCAVCNWHPLTWISHMADCQLYGLWPGGHHLTSVALHAATAIGLLLVLRQMTGELWPSALVAALFAVHPLRAESVAWISERKDVLSGLFFVLTIGAYVSYVRLPHSRSRYLVVLALFACGLMAKQMIVTLPCVLLLLDVWPLGRWSAAGLGADLPPPAAGRGWGPFVACLREKLPLFALAAAACWIAVAAQQGTIVENNQVSLASRAANALVASATYVVQLFAPSGLAAFYPYPGHGWPAWQVVGSLTLLAAISLFALATRGAQPYFLMGWLWFLGMLVPVVGIVKIGSQAMADRYTYLPHIGLCIAIVWGCRDLVRRWAWPRPVVACCAIGIVAAAMLGGWRQTGYWRNSETLWARALDCTTGNWLAYNDLGLALYDQGRVDEAIALYERAIEIYPSYGEAHSNLAKALSRQGRADAATIHAELSREAHPPRGIADFNIGYYFAGRGKFDQAADYFHKALQFQADDAQLHYHLGAALQKTGKTDLAREHFARAVEIQPNDANAQRAYTCLGAILDGEGQPEKARSYYQKAVAIQPPYATAHFCLANNLAVAGRLDQAIAQFEQTVELEPQNARALFRLAVLLATGGQHQRALDFYERLVALELEDRDFDDPLEPVFAVGQLDLVDALADQGHANLAVTVCQQALAAAEAREDRQLADGLRERLARYDAGKPRAGAR